MLKRVSYPSWMARLALLIAGVSPAVASAPAATLEGTAEAPQVVILTTDFVLDGKLARVAEAGAREGIAVSWYRAGRDDEAAVAAALTDAALVVLDTPRGNDAGSVRQAFAAALAGWTGPELMVIGGRGSARGLEPEQATRLAEYYANGTPANFAGFFRYWAVEVAGIASGEVPPPITFPDSGIYHPDFPGLVAETPEAYLDWLEHREQMATPRTRRVAVLMSQGQFNADQLDLVDRMIARIEARGASPWVFWFDGGESPGMDAMLAINGDSAVDAVINMTHLRGLSARPRELAALDIPLLQGFVYRDGGVADWQADDAGIPMRSVPAFLAVPEQIGAFDPVVIAALENGEVVPIDRQIDLLVGRAVRLARLRQLAPETRRLALMYWSYPPGERGVSASNLNVPRSLENVTRALADAGYRVPPTAAEDFEHVLPTLLDPWAGRAAPGPWAEATRTWQQLPLAAYRAWYDGLPADVRRRIEARWGPPEQDPMLLDGEPPGFLIPAWQLGELLVLPQPARTPGDTSLASYHDGALPPSHGYLATYLLVREHFAADALIHFGTHGNQEFLAGKARGLSVDDDAWLMLGELPVIYPYITDNIGEALQARRRGRAVTISHQTPPFAPAGLHGELLALHDLIHEWELLDEGPVRASAERSIIARVSDSTLYRDLGWTPEAMAGDFVGFEHELHLYLHELASDAQPLGLHTFGGYPTPERRVATLMQMLGTPLVDALGVDDAEELFVEDYTALAETAPWQFIARFVLEGEDPAALADPALETLARQALAWDRAMTGNDELAHLLAALEGRYIPTSFGGDPIRNPDILPTGRNLYGFDPARLPSPRAWEVGRALAEELVASHRERHGDWPASLGVSLWSSEAMRHQGVMEAQVLHLLGLEPRWDQGGRLNRLEIVPGEALGRPRVDVVTSVTGVYRDQFSQFIEQLAPALARLAELEEPGNTVAANTRSLAARLSGNGNGVAPAEALRLAAIRVFSSEPGGYGTGVPDGLFDTEGWDEDGELAEAYLARMQYGYGAGGLQGVSSGGINLYAEHLSRVEGALLGRSSNLHGLLSTDHPFEYLGGMAMAVRSLTGRTPELYVSNLRNPAGASTVSAGRFLAGELRSRYQHPGWIEGMRAEGYAGSLELLNIVNNFFGWQVTDPASVRDDQWAAFHDIYVRDSLELGLEEWFRDVNPEALQRIIERMLEAARRDYWDAGEEVLRDLIERHRALAEDGIPGRLGEYIDGLAAGFGVGAPLADALTQRVTGPLLAPVDSPPGGLPVDPRPWLVLLALALLVLTGAFSQARRAHRFPSTPAARSAA
ncbi:MAG: cobaltochelatase subunit CobN [Gammaproteobacteria bacterium]|nr:cobaltochelatase subunit CobN [Gammaproteobacteria bacterium]